MKNIYILLIFFLNFISLNIFAQNEFGNVVRFDKTIHDFGDIIDGSGEKKCSFKLTNISDKPIVIHRVITSCGCTEPTWTKSPIAPNNNGEISLIFSNDQGPYPFDKAITVYISGVNKPIILRVRGVAHEKNKSLNEIYIKNIGGFAMRENPIDVGQIEKGNTRSESVEIANVSNRSINVDFQNLSKGLKLELSSKTIPAKGKANLKYSIDTGADENYWGNTNYSATVVVNGQGQTEKLVVQALIKQGFTNLTSVQKRNAPLPQLIKSTENFGVMKKGAKKTLSFTIKNMGKEELVIHKIDGEDECAFAYDKKIAPNMSGKINVEINPKTSGEKLYIIYLTTNSPTRPIVNLYISGIVE